jgi:hypothetical protein
MTVYTESSDRLHGVKIGWDTVIEDAKAEIIKCRRRIERLERSIHLAQKMLKEGVPFGDSMQK